MVDIATIRNDSLSVIEPLINKINQQKAFEEKLTLTKRLCYHFHILAAGSLYADCKPLLFNLNLCRAAENWRRIHIIARKSGVMSPPSSDISTLFGSVAAKNISLSHRLIASLSTEFQPENEYEEDFEFSMIMRLLILNERRDDALLNKHFTKYAGIVSEDNAYRIPLIESLLKNNQNDWDDAFDAALVLRETFIEEKARNFTTPVTDFAVDRCLWLEGLAFIVLAESRDLAVEARNIIYCPSLARTTLKYTYENDWVIEI